MAFGCREVLQLRVLNINDAITDVEGLLVRTLGEHIELATILAADLGPVFADPRQIEHVLINLAVNSRDAMPTGGRLTIETANTELDAAYAAGPGNLPSGDYISLQVSDTGTGIPEDVIDRVFEPFFSTKPTGAGTGLGLATVYGIVTRAGGAVRVASGTGRGHNRDRLAARHRSTEHDQRPTGESNGDAGTAVLLVEDEPAVREMTRRVLDRGGYHVLTASGPDAIAIAGQQGRIDVLLTDVIMPKMMGKELADRVRALGRASGSCSCPATRKAPLAPRASSNPGST